jgi:3-amino-4-hydroxybenzoic acid synthase
VSCSRDTIFPRAMRLHRLSRAVYQRIDGIMASDSSDLAGLPPTITKVLWPGSGQEEVPPDVADVVILPYGHGDTRHLAAAR